MTTQITSALPRTVFSGINDVSTVAVTRTPVPRPTYMPKFWFFAERGPTTPQRTNSTSQSLYGANSFDVSYPYANHATAFINEVFAQGGTQVLQRLQPADALPNAGMRLSLDVLGPVAVPVYERNSDGSYVLDQTTNQPVTTGSTVQGFIAKWVVESLLDNTNASTYGQGTQKTGDQTDTATSTTSKRYPIWDFQVSFFGAYGRNLAARIYAPTTASTTAVDTTLMANSGTYPFRLSFMERANDLSTPTLSSTLLGSTNVTFGAKKAAKDPTTGQQIDPAISVIPAYQDLQPTDGSTPVYGPFGGMYVYQNNIDTLLAQFFAAEAPVTDAFSDFTSTDTAATSMYLFNFVSGVSSQNVKYHAFVMNTSDANAVSLNELSTIYAKDGSDGTMSIATFDALVQTQLLTYGDASSRVQDTAISPESVFIDPGYSMATKKTMGNCISLRKDTFVHLNTHVAGGAALTVDQELSAGLALYASVSGYIESDEFGTATVRASIFMQSGTLISSTYTDRLPVSFEVVSKSVAYMGAGNRIWKSSAVFDSARTNPGSVLTQMTNINVDFIPESGRQQFWNGKINWVQPFDETRYFYPALRTVVVNDTSVLTSYFNALICCELEKQGEIAWRTYTGEAKLSIGQILQGAENVVKQAVSDMNNFDSRAIVVPKATQTGADAQRGYSWKLSIATYLNNMATVETVEIVADRMANAQQNTTAALA